MEYTIASDTRSESGIDLFVFQNKDGTWKLVRRSVLFSLIDSHGPHHRN
jgi:hypothetical protein